MMDQARPAAELGTPSLLQRWGLLLVIFGAVLLRLALTPLYANLPDGLLDEGFWTHWMDVIHQHGVLNIFRESDTDYVGYHWVLWVLDLVYAPFGDRYDPHSPGLHLLVKIPPIIFDAVLIVTVYYAMKTLIAAAAPEVPDREARWLPLIAAGVIAFHPAVVYDSAVWAQTDAAIAAAMLGALLLVHRDAPAAGGVAYGLGLAVKPQPIIIAPLLLLALIRRGGWRATALFAAAIALVAVVVLGPWLIHGEAERIWDVYRTLFNQDRQRLSELAWNQWWIVDQAGDPRSASAVFGAIPALTYERLALMLSALATFLGLAYAWRRPGFAAVLVAAAYQAFAFYMLPIGSHERYLYPFFALLLPVALLDRRWLALYIPASVTFFLNLVIVAPPLDALEDRWVYGEAGVTVAAINTVLFASFTAVVLLETLRTPRPSAVRADARSTSALARSGAQT